MSDLTTFIKQTDVILLAAGTSSRMGAENKLLLQHNNKTLAQSILDQLRQLPFNQIILVTGHQQEKLLAQIIGLDDITVVHNPDFESGQTSSIQTGLGKLSEEASSFMVCLSDMPFLQKYHIEELLTFTRDSNADICRPIVDKVPGHPVIFKKQFAEQLNDCTDANGCRTVIQQNIELLTRFKTNDRAYIQDIDKQEDKQLLS